jgi:hypothetical protein
MRTFKEMMRSKMNLRMHIAVELNSDPNRLPSFFWESHEGGKPRTTAHALIEFNREIIRATSRFVCAYIIKPETYEDLYVIMSAMMDIRIEAPSVPIILDTRETPISKQKLITSQNSTVYLDGFVLDPNRMNWDNTQLGVIPNHDVDTDTIRSILGQEAIVYIEGFGATRQSISELVSKAKNKTNSGFIVGIGEEALYAYNGHKFAEAAAHNTIMLGDIVSKCLEVQCTTCGANMHTQYGNWVCTNGHHTTPFI